MLKKQSFASIALAIAASLNLIACGGGSNTTAETQPDQAKNNSTPKHDGNIIHTFAETDADFTVDLLAGTSDSDGDTLTVTHLTADNNNPNIGIQISGNKITISPKAFIDGLNDGDSQSIKYTFNVSDGHTTVARSLQVTITGISPIVTPSPPPSVVKITTSLNTHQYYEDSGVLAREKFINMHDTFSSSYPENVIKMYTEDFRLGQGRQFWSPIDVAKQIEGESKYPATSVAEQQGPSEVSKYHAHPHSKYAGGSNRIVVTSHPKNSMSVGNDPVEGARWAADYFEHYYDDVSRPLIYEPMNEPFVHAWEYKAQYNNSDDDTRRHMTKWFKEIGKAVDERPALKNLNVVGFSSAWPSLELPFNTGEYFAHWESRQKMFMDNAGPYMDGFAVHLYDGINIIDDSVPDNQSETRRSGSNAQAILDLIETYSHYKWDIVKPHAITEYGNIVDRAEGELAYDETVNSQTVRSFNNIMLELLAREDRILTSIPFIGGYTAWYWQNPNEGNGHPYVPAMWRPDPDKIQLNSSTNRWEFKNPSDPDNYLLNINHLFFEFWKDVEGHRIEVSSPDPDIQTAAYVNGDKAYVIVNNLDDAAVDIELDVKAITGLNFDSVELERLTVPFDAPATHTSTDLAVSGAINGQSNDKLAIKLAIGETVKFTIDVDKALPIDHTLQRKSYYSDDHLLKIVANQALTFNINNVDIATTEVSRASAMLRMGIGRAHTGSLKPTLTMNGTQVEVPSDWAGYDQKNRKDGFFGSIDIPVPYNLIKANNQIKVTFPDNGGKVSSMILEVSNKIDNVVVTNVTIDADQTIKAGQTYQASASLTPTHAPNLSVTWSSDNEATATVSNNGLITAVAQGSANITATASNGLSASLTVTVPAADPNYLAEAAKNPDFETGSYVPWGTYWQTQPSSKFDVTADAKKDGSYGLHVQISDDSSHNGISLSKHDTPQVFGENQGRKFQLSFDIKLNSAVGSAVNMKFFMVPRNDSTNKDEWVSRIEKGFAVTNTTEWQTIIVDFDEANWGEHLARLELYFVAGSGAINAYIDNVSIKELI
ncbi:Beta-agarase [Catenovulum agarivorans DS-2]|uniref:Beta-agarase n=1 Tax=Catenovulum agarivorans DS-2 TaxID=1328313 RepID=W7QV70_9ALTE|nr:Ig-like domain-containing protein [Catenovulum agarivorans]EWH09185.1 Beta-agarase [Catenovulum agarivorans DS-2]